MTKEQFFLEMENRTKELEKIQEILREMRAQGDLSENEEYDRLRKRQHEMHDVVEWYQKLTDETTSYKEFIWAYERYLEYSKEHKLEDISFLNDRIAFLEKHYKKEEQFSIDFSYYPPDMVDIENGFCFSTIGYQEKDLKNVLNYFNKKEEKDIYKWELEYVTFLLFYDQICHTSYAGTFFGDYTSLQRTKECNEYVNSLDKLIKGLDSNEFSFNLLLWTIFKTYHYLYNQNSEFVVNKSDLMLIDKLITLSRKVLSINCEKRIIKENSNLNKREKIFIFNLSQLLCLDLIHTIYNGFPDYYDTCIMFLGYGLHIPGGCSDLYASMKSFKSYVNEITNYDYWLELNGPRIFEKMNIKHDYKEVLIDNELI